jgi:poly(3-hydroxyalkanoate) synthetase
MRTPSHAGRHPPEGRIGERIASLTTDLRQLQWHTVHHMRDMLYGTPELSGKARRRATFWRRKWPNAVAPTNNLLTNPIALRKFVDSRGHGLWRGMNNMLEDLKAGDVRFDGYVRDGIDTIVRVACDFTGADRVHAMHAWYLRELYLNNRLIQPGALTVAGQPIDLHAIRQPLYAVAAKDDHIAPWAQAFRTLHHIAADKRLVLSSSGHILGLVSPPVRPPKSITTNAVTSFKQEKHHANPPCLDLTPSQCGEPRGPFHPCPPGRSARVGLQRVDHSTQAHRRRAGR